MSFIHQILSFILGYWKTKHATTSPYSLNTRALIEQPGWRMYF
ncbi:MAG: hypothetical protein ABS944_12795 [Solibacillus sp.]